MPQNFASTRPVNPPGAEPKITEELLWKGLERKARFPKEFIPVTASEVLVDEGKRVVRSATFGDKTMQEEIFIFNNTILYFESTEGHRITNVVSYDTAGELQLTFTFTGGIPGTDPEAKLSTGELNAQVGQGVSHTIDVIRELVKEGKL